MSDSARHERAREQSISWLVDAVRRGDYLEAAQWLDTLSAVDSRSTLGADHLIARWRGRAQRYRGGASDDPDGTELATADYRGLFGALLHHANDGIVITGVEDGWILECSDSFSALTGYPRAELLGRTSPELGLVDAAERKKNVGTIVAQGGGRFVISLRRKDGARIWAEHSTQLLGDELLLTIVRDVTARMEAEDELRDRAGRDQLTGLYGRQRFVEELERRYAEARRFGDPLALVVCDLDDLQEINTSYGLDVGDRALRALASVARATVRAIDVVARVGTDEFAILLPRSGGDAAMRVVSVIEREMGDAELATPDGPVALSVSCGLAVAGDGVADADELLQAAEQMLSTHRPRR